MAGERSRLRPRRRSDWRRCRSAPLRKSTRRSRAYRGPIQLPIESCPTNRSTPLAASR